MFALSFLFVLRQYQQINAFYISKGNELKAGEETNNIMTIMIIYSVKIAIRLLRSFILMIVPIIHFFQNLVTISYRL